MWVVDTALVAPADKAFDGIVSAVDRVVAVGFDGHPFEVVIEVAQDAVWVKGLFGFCV